MTRWLMLGAGAITRECFLPAFEYLNALPSLTVVDLAVPAQLRAAYPQVEFIEEDFRNASGIFAGTDGSAAIVAVPNQFHEAAALRLLESGMHVLCEKPLALTEAACRTMGEVAAKAQRLLAVNMIRRCYPSYRLAGRVLEDGQIGRLEAIHIEHGGAFAWPARSMGPFLRANGGVFADMGVHYLDLAEWWAGTLQLVSYRDDSRGGVEAEAEAELRSSTDVIVRLRLSRLNRLANQITLLGTEGRIELSSDSISSFRLHRTAYGEGVEIRPLRSFRSPGLPDSFAACFVERLQQFEERIAAGDLSTRECEEAVRAVRIIEQAYRQRQSAPPARHGAPAVCEAGPAMVTGATGFIGARLVERLFDDGFSEVTGIVRRPETCAPVARFPIELNVGSLLDFEFVRRMARGRRYVFHLAYGRDGAGAETVTVEGTQNVVNAAMAEGCEAVVILSTVNVLGWPDGDVDETAPYRPSGGAYGRSKAQMERWCLSRARESKNTRIVILLPSCVYGPGGKTFTELPAKLASEGAFAWISQGRGIANYLYIDNLIDAILRAASLPAAHGQRFIVNDGWTTWADFLGPIVMPWGSQIRNYEPGELTRLGSESHRGSLKRAILAAASNAEFRRELKQSPIGPLARTLASRTAGLAQRTPLKPASLTSGPLAAGGPSHPPAWLEDLFGVYQTRFSSRKARSLLGWTPRVDLAQGQLISVQHLRMAGLHPGMQAGMQAGMPEGSRG